MEINEWESFKVNVAEFVRLTNTKRKLNSEEAWRVVVLRYAIINQMPLLLQRLGELESFESLADQIDNSYGHGTLVKPNEAT